MAIELVTKYLPYVDELFSTEAKKSLFTNNDYSWDGAATVKIYKIGTSQMNDYGRNGPASGNWSRYGEIKSLDATTESMTIRKDRSFTFALDRLDQNESEVKAASALARQIREIVMPEIDTYTIAQMVSNAGQRPTAAALTASNIYENIIDGSKALDTVEAPETGRVLLVSSDTYRLLKISKDIAMETDIGNDLRIRGVIAMLDGMPIIRVPVARLPKTFGFMIAHPVATVAPVKLESYRIHEDPPGISGSLVEGRFTYDAFVLDNKKDAIYYHETVIAQDSGEDDNNG